LVRGRVAKRADVTDSVDNFCDALVSWLRAHEIKNDVSHSYLGKPSTDPTRNDVAKSKILDVLYGEYSIPRHTDRRSFPSRKMVPLSPPTLPKKRSKSQMSQARPLASRLS
jgi:hypothetical protein